MSATSRPKPSSRSVVDIRAKAEELFETDPRFRELPYRIAQARELRAQLCGEETRDLDDMPNYRTSVIKQIIGEVANDPSRTK